MNVGLIGFGMVAERFHAPLIAVEPRLQLTHVVERHRARSQELYPQVQVLRSAEELLQTEVDLVVILTPNESHFPLARKALEAGKHVLLDKPMTVTSEQADQLTRQAQELGLVLSVFHNRRWDSDFLTLQELLKDGTLGEIVSVESHFDRYRPFLKGGWREEDKPGSGVLYDLGSHLLDQSFQMFGLPKAVLADLRQERAASQATDGFLVLLEYQDVKVELKVSCLAAESPLRFKVRGTQGTWVQHGFDPQEEALRLGERPGGSGWGEGGHEHWGRLYRHQDGGGSVPITGEMYPEVPGNYLMFYSQLAEALATVSSPPVLAIEARNVIRAIELCLKSHQKRRWVDWS